MAKSIKRGSELPTNWSTAAVFLAVTWAAGIEPATAAIDLSAGATTSIEHDSNPLALSESRAQNNLGSGDTTIQGDTVKRLTADVAAAAGANGPTQAKLQAKYSKVDYTQFNDLDHAEYNVSGNLDWKPSRVFDASLQASQIRAPIAQNEVGGARVEQQTSTLIDTALRLRPTPQWQLSLEPRWYNTESTIPGADKFGLRESGGRVGLGYLGGTGPLIPGLFVMEMRGKYTGIENATRYRQRSAGFSLNYKVTDFSSFSLFAGRTQRTTHLVSPSNNPQVLALQGTKPIYTGTLAYQRRLSVKTNIVVGVFRDFQQYAVGVNTKVGTGVNGQIDWSATNKLSVALSGQLVRSTVDGLEATGFNNNREDLERSGTLSVKYRATHHVLLRTYLSRLLSNSTLRSSVYDRTTAGLELTVSVD